MTTPDPIAAFRAIIEVLASMKETATVDLDQAPEKIRQRLEARRSAEQWLAWGAGGEIALIDFADFADFAELVIAADGVLPSLERTVPSKHLLHTRLLELEALRTKIACARSITAAEASFVAAFHQRFFATTEAKAATPAPEAESETEAEAAEATEVVEVAEAEAAKEVEDTQEPENDGPAEGEAKAAEQEEGEAQDTAAEAAPQPHRPRVDPDEYVDESVPADAALSSDEDGEAEQSADDADVSQETLPDYVPGDEAAQDEAPTPPYTEAIDIAALPMIRAALEASDTKRIMEGLYKEVMQIAEVVSAKTQPPFSHVWEAVAASDWFERNREVLGLTPLTGFYEIVGDVRQLLLDEGTADRVEPMLKQRGFAQNLLRLRDLFQRLG